MSRLELGSDLVDTRIYVPKPHGLYEALLTRGLADALTSAPAAVIEPLDPHRGVLALAELVRTRTVAALRGLHGDDADAQRVSLVNALLALLEDPDDVPPPARELRALLAPATPPATPTAPPRPTIPLSTSDLLVNGPHDLSLGPQLAREIASADRVDLLCSFVKYSGYQRLESALAELAHRRGGQAIRVLTTVYMKATDKRALDALAALGAQVRVSYDTTNTRLHAKAWLLHRDSGFTTAYVGSSNLSAAAMHDGLEWNVRLSAIDNGGIVEKFASTFEQYWEDSLFRAYDAEEFRRAVDEMKRAELAPYLLIDIEPRPHQREMLEALESERARGHMKNLVVAATGSGKTIVAALDYKRLRKALPRARLLFVAHRREILEQSLRAFRVVLRDGSFGETLAAGERPDRWEHVFASVQSLHQSALAEIPPDAFDVVIVDEFHHAAADTYDALLSHLTPRVLVGLTATPERADGRSIMKWFDDRVAAELRLWKALDQGLLSPFQYFGVGGAPDASGVRWSRGRYDASALSNVYTADHFFAKRVVQEVSRRVLDPHAMRALGFCVDIAHAEFMAAEFNKAGLAAAAVSANSTDAERRQHLAALRDGSLRCLFSVDLFNEGVDVPDVDTVLFLRPTESATVFLQQLGRGLRRSEGKACLTVLDFIGGAHRKFRFDLRYRAIVGGTRRGIARDIEDGFPLLPSGCSIQLDREAQETVLANVRAQLALGFRGMVEDLKALGEGASLRDFLRETGLDLEDVYAGDRSFTSLRRAAGFAVADAGPDDAQLERALSRMLHVDDAERLEGMRALVRGDVPRADDADAIQRWLFILLGYVRQPYAAMPRAWDALWASPALRDELDQLLGVVSDRVRQVTHRLEGALAWMPLRVHASYTLDEILAGVDERTSKGGVKRIQTGVYHLAPRRCDLLFVTLEKSEKEYTPTTLYNDYAISPTRFHWETQSNCHEGTPTGRRYLESGTGKGHVLLFVRKRRVDARGVTSPYVFLGDARHASHRGARPMQIEWELTRPMPAALYQETKVAAG